MGKLALRSAVRELVRKSYEEESEPQKGDILDCALGRNSFGTSTRVLEFAQHYEWFDLWQHPDTSYSDLKQEICGFWSDYADLIASNIKVANGSCVVLSRFNKLFIEPGTRVLGYVPQFKEYMIEAKILGGIYEAVPLDYKEKFRFSLDRFLSKLAPDYCIAYIDNPNNPTGQLIELDDIEILVREAEKKNIITIIDEAYGDYMEEKNSAVRLINRYENLVVTRTFTKGYGIGRFRVGYAILSTELGEYYNRIELPFSVSTMGASLAREAIKDHEFILTLRQQVRTEKKKLTNELSRRGYSVAESWNSLKKGF